MKLIKGKDIKWYSSNLNAKIWLWLLAQELVNEFYVSLECGHFAHAVNLNKIRREVSSAHRNGETKGANIENSSFIANQSCQFHNFTRQLVCNGSIDFSYIQKVKSERMEDLIVKNYEAEPTSQRKNWCDSDLNGMEQSYKLSYTYEKLKGEMQLKDAGIPLKVIVSLILHMNSPTNFTIQGEAFSNKGVKISRSLKGHLILNYMRNQKIVSINIESANDDAEWELKSDLTFIGKNAKTKSDDWFVYGIITSDHIPKNRVLLFEGLVKTTSLKGECAFSGEVNLKSANLLWNISGSVSSPMNKQITIPRAAFSDISVRNVIFKDSSFFNDFDENVFEGLKGVETVSFVGSKLEDMPKFDDLFQSLTALKEIYIEDCATPRLQFGTKAIPTEKVQKLSFKGSGPLNFDENSFIWLENSNLTFLSLRSSSITLSPNTQSVLKRVNKTLKYLDISHSNLKDEKDLASLLEGVEITHLAAEGLHLQKIPTAALANVKQSLQYLSLRGSNFKKVFEKNMFNVIFEFPSMPQLTEINLEECQINYFERGAFENLPNLKILRLGYNHLENIQDGWISVRPEIRQLDLSSNGLTPQVFYTPTKAVGTNLNLSLFENLEVLDLSNGIFMDTSKLLQSLRTNLRHLFLRNINLTEIPEGVFENLRKLQTLDLSLNRNLKAVSINLFKNLTSLKTLLLRGCRIKSASIHQVTDVMAVNLNSTLENLSHLDLSYNNIKVIDSGTIKAYPKLKILNLSGNGITTWKNSLLSSNVSLEVMFLDENKIETISDNMLDDIKQIRYIKLGNNPFICGPYVYDILKLVKSNQITFHKATAYGEADSSTKRWGTAFQSKALADEEPTFSEPFDDLKSNYYKAFPGNNDSKVNFVDWLEGNYVCFSWSSNKFIPFGGVNETFESLNRRRKEAREMLFLWLPIAGVTGTVITLGIIFWKLLDIHLITKAVRNAVALSFLSRGNKEPEKYEYNVFVSYSDRDRPWVLEHLLPRLESYGSIKVCLHERDFQVGLSILENIIASIDNSQNIILVLSRSFLKSQWCQYEMHLAQHRLLEKGRDQLILVLLENIPLVKRPKTLRYLMMTKTYLEWPANSRKPRDVDIFWNRLLKSLKYN